MRCFKRLHDPMSISELLRKYKSLDDKVAAILYETGLDKIPTDMKQLHTAFYEVNKKYPVFFDNLHFKKGGRFPYSESLDQTFPGLAISGLLACQNPAYEYYVLDDEKRTIIREKILPLFVPEERELIQQIGKELKESFT